MAVQVEFIRDGRVAISRYDKNLTGADVASAFKVTTQQLEKATAPMHSIADFSEVTTFPPSMLSLARTHRNEINHPMMGRFVVITHNSFLKTMLGTVLRFMPSINLRIVGTMDEALAEVDKLLASETQVKSV